MFVHLHESARAGLTFTHHSCSTHATLEWWEAHKHSPSAEAHQPWWLAPRASRSDTLQAERWRSARCAGSRQRMLQARMLAGASLADGLRVASLMPELLQVAEQMTWAELCDWHNHCSWGLNGAAAPGEALPLSARLRRLNCAVFAVAAAVQDALRPCKTEEAPASKLVANAETAVTMAANLLESVRCSLEASLACIGGDEAAKEQGLRMLDGASAETLCLLVRHELCTIAALISIWADALQKLPADAPAVPLRAPVGTLAYAVETTCVALAQAVRASRASTEPRAGAAGLSAPTKKVLESVAEGDFVEAQLQQIASQQQKQLANLASLCDRFAAVAKLAQN